MRTKEDQKILDDLKELAKVDNILGISHWESDGCSGWSFKSPKGSNPDDRYLTLQTGDGGAIEYYKIWLETMNRGVELPFGGVCQQIKENPPIPFKSGKFTKEGIMKMFESLYNQKSPENLTYNQIDINAITPLLPPHEEN